MNNKYLKVVASNEDGTRIISFEIEGPTFFDKLQLLLKDGKLLTHNDETEPSYKVIARERILSNIKEQLIKNVVNVVIDSDHIPVFHESTINQAKSLLDDCDVWLRSRDLNQGTYESDYSNYRQFQKYYEGIRAAYHLIKALFPDATESALRDAEPECTVQMSEERISLLQILTDLEAQINAFDCGPVKKEAIKQTMTKVASYYACYGEGDWMKLPAIDIVRLMNFTGI